MIYVCSHSMVAADYYITRVLKLPTKRHGVYEGAALVSEPRQLNGLPRGTRFHVLGPVLSRVTEEIVELAKAMDFDIVYA